MRVGLIYNIVENLPKPPKGAPKDIFYELDHWSVVESYKKALEEGGHKVFPIEGNSDLALELKQTKVDICFNTCEGYRGESREAQVPAILEMLGISYTGSKVLALALTLDKAMTKRVLEYSLLPTPRFQEFKSANEDVDPKLKFPLFVKPNSEGTGIGIGKKSIVKNRAELARQIRYLLRSYDHSVLVEEYIDGSDVTVGIVGNWPDLHIFPISMIDKKTYKDVGISVYGSEMKVLPVEKYYYLCPAPLPKHLEKKLKDIAVEVMRVTQTLDFCRVDFRLAKGSKPYVLEINSLPGISPISDMTLMAEAEGWAHADLVNCVLEAAIRRYKMAV